MQVLVFVDGIDAMTSKHMSARIAYSTSDIYMNEQVAFVRLPSTSWCRRWRSSRLAWPRSCPRARTALLHACAFACSLRR